MVLDSSKNYFELFGLPTAYAINFKALADRYRELQGLVHPDRFVGESEQQQRLAVRNTARINEAYDTLKEPILRAQYLLKLHGVDMDLQRESTKDAAFLAEQLELREELESLRDERESLQLLEAFQHRISEMLNQLICSIAVNFETPTEKHLGEVREAVRKMQFLNKLYREADSLEAALEDGIH